MDEEIEWLRERVTELEYENTILLLERDEGVLPTHCAPATGLIDPYLTAEMTELRVRLAQAESNVATLKENSTATSFSNEGPLGQRLLEKCRTLLRENDKLGQTLVSSRITQLEQGGHFLKEKEAILIGQLKVILAYKLELEQKLMERDKEILKLKSMLAEGDLRRRPR